MSGSEVVDARSLTEAIAALKKVETRWLVANGRGFGEEDATSLARALRTNFSLQELSLAGNCIGPDGAAALGSAMGGHPSLREVYLQKNKIGQNGVERLAANMKAGGGSKNLQVLNLSHNQLGPTLPSDLALSTLRALQVKGNEISEVPPIFAQCSHLETVCLDANPLKEPALDLYHGHGWTGMRQYLNATLEQEKAENVKIGLEAISHQERDERLFGPIHLAIKQWSLQFGLEAALRAKEVYIKLGPKGKENKEKAEELIHTITQLRAMECPEMGFDPLDYVLACNGINFYVSRETLLAQAPVLANMVTSQGEEGLFDYKARTVTRKTLTIDGGSPSGVKCLLCYFHLNDLSKALELCYGQDAFTETPMDPQPSNDGSSSSDKTGSSTTYNSSDRVSPHPGPGPVASSLPDHKAAMTFKGQDLEGFESFEYSPSQTAGDDLHLEGLPADLKVLFDVLNLARRFDIDEIYHAGPEVLLERLRRSNVCVALVVAHLRQELSLKQVCFNYIKDFCSDFTKDEWLPLQHHGTLMLEVMEVLSRRSGKESPRSQISHLMMGHLLRRLEAAEARADHETELRKVAEAQIRKSAEMQLECIRTYQYS